MTLQDTYLSAIADAEKEILALLFPQLAALLLILDRNLYLLNICHFSEPVPHKPHIKDAQQTMAAGLDHVALAERAAKIEDLEDILRNLKYELGDQFRLLRGTFELYVREQGGKPEGMLSRFREELSELRKGWDFDAQDVAEWRVNIRYLKDEVAAIQDQIQCGTGQSQVTPTMVTHPSFTSRAKVRLAFSLSNLPFLRSLRHRRDLSKSSTSGSHLLNIK